MTATNSRRSFFKKALRFATLGAAASTGVYLIGSAFKELDGSLTAGAKTWEEYICPFQWVDYSSCGACGFSWGQTCYFDGATCVSAGSTCEIGSFWTGSNGWCLRCQ
jgi:hypothetical protein